MWEGSRGGTLQRSRTPINGDERETLERSRIPRNGDELEDGLNEKRVVMTRKIGMIGKGKMVLIKYNLNGKLWGVDCNVKFLISKMLFFFR